MALQNTTEAANSAIQLRDQKIDLQKQISDQEKKDLEQTFQTELQNTRSSAEIQIKKEEHEKLDYKKEVEALREQLEKERRIYSDSKTQFEIEAQQKIKEQHDIAKKQETHLWAMVLGFSRHEDTLIVLDSTRTSTSS